MGAKYILKQGLTDKKRLNSLSKIYDKGSKKFIINNNKEKTIKKILDIGSGQGSMSKFFSETYPKAQIFSIDISQEQLKISQIENASQKNIQYIVLDIESENISEEILDQIKFADLIYIRYLLLHLKEWNTVFNNIYKILNKNGQVIIEEPGFPWITYPYSEILQKAANISQEFLHSLNYKFDCIPHLWNYINNQNQFQIENVEFNHPILKNYQEKSLMWMSFAQIKKPLIKANLYTEEEFNLILDELKNIAKNPKYIGISLKLIQLSLTKNDL